MATNAGFSLTGEEGPSIQSLQDQLKRCSLAMGMSRETLESKAATLNSIATNLSLYLTAIHSIVPRHFSPSYSSPCWESHLALPTLAQKRQLGSLSHTHQSHQERQRKQLYRELLAPALRRRKTRLLCLPAFFLAGFPKSGTTTLHRALSRHRAISAPSQKEPHWWTRMPLDNEDQNYLRLATLNYFLYFSEELQSSIKKNPRLLAYDGSQSTLWDSNFAEDNQDYCGMAIAVSRVLPAAKFLVVMREPVSRTYSHFLYSCTWSGHRPPGARQFHELAVSAVDTLTSCLSNGTSLFECVTDPRLHQTRECGSLGYRLVISLYHLHLSKWLQVFPRENFLLLRLEDLSQEPNHFMGRVTRFLGISDLKPSSTRWLRTHRENQQKVKHVVMLPETRELLSEFFRPFNEKLVELTGDKRFLWTDLH